MTACTLVLPKTTYRRFAEISLISVYPNFIFFAALPLDVRKGCAFPLTERLLGLRPEMDAMS